MWHGLPLWIATLNVRSSHAGNLEASLKSFQHMATDIAVIMETKLNHDRCTTRKFGYSVCATKARSSSQASWGMCQQGGKEVDVCSWENADKPHSTQSVLQLGEWWPNEPADHDIGQLDHHLSPAPFHSAHMKQAQLPTCNDTWRHDTPTTSYMLLVTWGTRNAPIASSTCGGGQEPSHQHLQSALCWQGRKQCAAHLAKGKLSKQLSNLPTFYVEGMEIEQVDSFTYLGCELSSADENFQVCLRDLSKAKNKWGVLSRVLKQDEASMAYKSCTYLIVVSTVLLYGAETWVINAWIQHVLEAFHNCCACHITTWYICHIGTDTATETYPKLVFFTVKKVRVFAP